MAGRLVYLMGPSGGGKDTVLQGLARLLGGQGYVAPRLVTRRETPPDPYAVHVSVAEFERLEAAGCLAMAWRANGFSYGVMRDIDERLAAGRDVLVNGSREYLHEAGERYPDLVPVLLDVDEALLAHRLQKRGRESEQQIRQRLARNAGFEHLSCGVKGSRIVRIDNSGEPRKAIAALYEYLQRSAEPLYAEQG